MGASPALEIDGVTQQFSLRHEKTLRGLFVAKVLRRYATSETFTALDDVSLEIATGSTVGLIGHNGSGKSTLLKIIGGVLTPTRGEVRRRGSLAALLELGAGFHHELTGRENVFLNAEVLGIPRDVARKRFDEIVEFSGVEQFIDTPMKFYSSGMFVRLGFAVAVYAEPDILLVDEVLAVGDEAFQRKCLDVVRRFQGEGRTIVLVTHDMRQVEDFCDRAILLDHGQAVADDGPGTVIGEFRKRLALPGPPPDEPPVAVSGVRVVPRLSDGGSSVEVAASLTGRAPHFDVRVDIVREAGPPLCSASSRDADVGGAIDGSRTLLFDFLDLPLSAGDYTVSVSARGGEPPTDWRSGRTAVFSIPGPSAESSVRCAIRVREAD